MDSRQISGFFLLAACACSESPPDIKLEVPPVVLPGNVPITAAISYKGAAGSLKYHWDVQQVCTVSIQDPSTATAVLEVGSDCAGKTVPATLTVTTPKNTFTRPIVLQVKGGGEALPLHPEQIQVTLNVPPEPGNDAEVTGTVGPMPGVQQLHLWLVVNPVGNSGYWPQGGPLVPNPPSGSWAMNATFGGVPGERFNVSVVLANDAAHKAFQDYLTEGEAKKFFPGKPLPAGAQPLKTVMVTKGAASPCTAEFLIPKAGATLTEKQQIEISLTQPPVGKNDFYVVLRKKSSSGARYWYKGSLARSSDGKRLTGEIELVDKHESVTLSAIATTEEGKRLIEDVHQRGTATHKFDELLSIRPHIVECAAVDVKPAK